MNHSIRTIFFALFFISAIGCSTTPSTDYFTLVADSSIAKNNQIINKNGPPLNIGVGPLSIPDHLDSFSILSLENGNQVLVNEYQLWAGNLKTIINQVLADNLSMQLGIDGIWAFPWDNRNRPEIQIRVVFERFIGELGKDVTLQAKWVVLSEYGKKEVITNKTTITETLSSDDYLSYVKALNNALNKFSLILAEALTSL